MADKKGLVFYERSHRYKLDGEWVPGVTTLLGGAMPKPALPKWSAKSVAEYVATHRDTIEHLYEMGELPMVAALKDVPWQQRDEAANRGTEVHSYAERIVNDEEVDVPEELVGHVESCIAFLEEWDIRPVLVEAAVGSREHRYAGTLDLVADSRHAPRAIYDYKTSRSGIYGETAMQLVGYAFAEFYVTEDAGGGKHEVSMSGLGIEESWGVHIRADGYDVYPLKYGPDVYAEFLTLLEASRINARVAGDWKIPGSGYVGLAWQNTEEMTA